MGEYNYIKNDLRKNRLAHEEARKSGYILSGEKEIDVWDSLESYGRNHAKQTVRNLENVLINNGIEFEKKEIPRKFEEKIIYFDYLREVYNDNYEEILESKDLYFGLKALGRDIHSVASLREESFKIPQKLEDKKKLLEEKEKRLEQLIGERNELREKVKRLGNEVHWYAEGKDALLPNSIKELKKCLNELENK